MSYFKSQDFFSRLGLSFGAVFITLAPLWISCYFVFLYMLSGVHQSTEYKYYIIWALIITVCFILVVLILMIFGWILNCKSNSVINTIVVIATFCAIPHVIISFYLIVGIVVLPLYILAGYLVFWYLKGGKNYQPKVKPLVKVKIKKIN